ncbi:MAG: hypothetical protein J5701_00085 [Bacteroidales bacterium]|nr:hypothetical protein [Bacteroidales bacterium]
MHCLTDYDIKLLVALNESLRGHRQCTDFFINNGYPELAALSLAIQSDTDALQWLFDNGYPEFGVLSNAIDGEELAIEWLQKYHLDFLSVFAAACRQETPAIRFFVDNKLKVFIFLINTIQELLIQQSWDADDIHKIRRS